MTSASWQAGSPAYTPVSARRTLTRPAAEEQPQPQPQPQPVKIDWPQPVRDYVSRTFVIDKSSGGDNNNNNINHSDITAKLKSVITQAAESNLLASIDWPNHPLPQDLIRAERAAALNNSASKKRKSTDLDSLSPLPPWRQNKNPASLAERMSFPDRTMTTPDKRQKKAAEKFRTTAPPSKSDLQKRAQRFELGNTGPTSPYVSSSRDDSPMPDANDGPLVGTCQTLEKNYFRLTAPPKPDTVRPLPILKQTLDLLIDKWKEAHHYGYICDQFKSLRQDLTVQHIKNDFTLRVYETHARIALEKGDLGEYNQCQTQLRALYKQKLGGCPGEFLAYRILYTIYTCNRTGMNDVLADLTPADKQNPPVKHALSVRAALATSNYHRFFRLFNDSPNMGAYLMDMFIDRERLSALASICRAYKPGVYVSWLTEELAFVDDQQCAQFLCDYGAQNLLESKPEGVYFASGKSGNTFDSAKQKSLRAIDIKGQI